MLRSIDLLYMTDKSKVSLLMIRPAKSQEHTVP